MSLPAVQAEAECLWSCYSCDYVGPDFNEIDGREHCPNCGTQAGDGFGMAENDPRYRGKKLLEDNASLQNQREP